MKVTHEEADLIIANQVVSAVLEGEDSILVMCDDTDVFLLLMHFYISKNLKAKIFMQGTKGKRRCIDIGKPAVTNKSIVPSLLSFHALTGCDSVPGYHSIGKVGALGVLKKSKLIKIGNPSATTEEVLHEGKIFLSQCYKTNPQDDMSITR